MPRLDALAYQGTWFKEHLRIEAFYATSENAVITQNQAAAFTHLAAAIRTRPGTRKTRTSLLAPARCIVDDEHSRKPNY